ncbi:MAG: hypothetical protein ACP5R4_09980, partial [Armatimonadota bacterium]
RLVKTGKTLDGRVEIVSGLSNGETVAVTNVERLSDAVKVKRLERGLGNLPRTETRRRLSG